MGSRAVWGWMLACLGSFGLWGCSDSVESAPGPVGGAGGEGGAGGGGGAGPMTPSECLGDHRYPVPPDYDQFNPVMGTHCKGTNHQDIVDVEKLVFLGDSITEGTVPTPMTDFYRTRLTTSMTEKFPGLEVTECAENGARVGDVPAQIAACFPAPEPKRTLIVMTIGGNDIVQWPENMFTQDQAIADADAIGESFGAVIASLKDPALFPNGSFVVFANVYEFTDGTGELESCPGAQFIGLTGTYTQGAPAVAHLEERLMQVAVDTQTDMLFLLEQFCGHGYRRDLMNTCYLGPNAELWFDISCIHPNPTGHGKLAELFQTIVDE